MIRDRIALIKRYFDDLENVEKERGKSRYYAKSMLLFSIINASISLGEDLISMRKLQIPGNYYEIFDILEKNRVIGAALRDDMKMLIRLRNLLAHEYDNIDEKEIEKLGKKIESVKELVRITAASV